MKVLIRCLRESELLVLMVTLVKSCECNMWTNAHCLSFTICDLSDEHKTGSRTYSEHCLQHMKRVTKAYENVLNNVCLQ
jgi:hypothetical protein